MNNFEDSLLKVANFTPHPFKEPSAWLGHLPFAAWLIRTIKPKVFVELGSHWGHSYFAFCQAASEAKHFVKCYAVDTWQGEEHSGHYDEKVFYQVNEHNKLHYSDISNLLRMTFDEASSYFSNGSIELLHIDGLHTYEAVKHDFETWLPKLAPGAVVLFHDTNVREREFGVWKLWEELQVRYPNNIEFVHSHGLGVLQIDDLSSANKLLWLDCNAAEKQQLKDYFSALGMRQLERFELEQIKAYAGDLTQAVAVQDRHVLGLNQQIAERDQKIAERDQQIADRDKQIADHDQQIANRKT